MLYAVKIGSRLIRKFGAFADDKELGEVVGEMLFRLAVARRMHIGTDVRTSHMFRSTAGRRIAPCQRRENAWDVVPDLAVEVISPYNLAEESLQKVREYFQAGVTLVWVVYPEERQVYVYESPTQIRVLTTDDTLDGGTVLPGSSCAWIDSSIRLRRSVKARRPSRLSPHGFEFSRAGFII